MRTLGLDIGGANLKRATQDGHAASTPFPLWQTPDRLADALRDFLSPAGEFDALAVTMTGELADCFATRAQGVERILSSVEEVVPAEQIHVWSTEGRFVTPGAAREKPLKVAAANWHAQATWAGQFWPRGQAVLIDIGSTTTDLVPLQDGVPCPVGLTDPERLLSGELVYRGVRRTPLMALGRTLLTSRQEIPLAAEVFATTLDVFLLLGEVAENAGDTGTANGRPATRDFAHDRIARMACSDRMDLTRPEAEQAARAFRERLMVELLESLSRVLNRFPGTGTKAITSGSGEFLAKDLCARADLEAISLGEGVSPAIAESACAYAVARLLASSPGSA